MLYSLTETNPLERFWDLRRDFDRLFNEAVPSGGPEGNRGVFVPALDVAEDTDGLTLRAEVPGVEPGKLSVTVNGHVLTVEGERESRRDEKSDLHRCERSFGKFARSLHLPEHYDVEKIEAAHEHGILTIRVPKSEAAKPRTIKIAAT